jgi:hypothetical protein
VMWTQSVSWVSIEVVLYSADQQTIALNIVETWLGIEVHVMSAPLEGSANMEMHSIGSGHDLPFEPWSSFVATIRDPLHQTRQASDLD